MKSSIEILKSRGFAQEQDMDAFINLSYGELIKRVNSPSPVERTAAIRTLNNKYSNDVEIIEIAIERLYLEKSLYTKIEICKMLESGGSATAKEMIKHLGKIGNNQHKSLPEHISKKVSYPLPRDIIGRSLSKMNKDILPLLIDVLYSKDKNKISEVLDAIGFLIFYNQDGANLQTFEEILGTLNLYSKDDLIVWKGVICFSAFPIGESIAVLRNIIDTNQNRIIREEASRSLRLITNKGIKGKSHLRA